MFSRKILSKIKQAARNYKDYGALFLATPQEVERHEWMFYLKHIEKGMTVFDIGANLGHVTLLFAQRVGAQGQVHAFEPSKNTFENLSQICKLSDYPQIRLNNMAVSNEIGTVQLYTYSDHPTWNSLANRPLSNYNIDTHPAIIEEVPSITIDVYCQKQGISYIDLLKIDVEGAEYQVLRGAEQMLKTGKIRLAVFEFGQTTFDMNNKPDEIIRYINDLGYRVSNLVPGNPVIPVKKGTQEARYAMLVLKPVSK